MSDQEKASRDKWWAVMKEYAIAVGPVIPEKEIETREKMWAMLKQDYFDNK